MRGPRQSASGFTLIELMIVIAIVAVLAMIALPSFTEQIRKSRRAEAITGMAQVQQMQERYRANRTTYGDVFIVPPGGSLRGVGVTGDADDAATYTTPGGYYLLSLAAVSGSGYELRANAQASQASDMNCQFMRMTLAGGNIAHDSGTSLGSLNPRDSTANRRCWNR
jgi:type IV pilus assembly protein PilE